jgi:carbon-monoxide dehydrogenase large subunit
MASCSAHPHAHAKILSINADAAKAAPGVLAVLTGADWEASGFGDLPRADQRQRKGGRPMYQPRNPALVKDRVRWVGDYVAFVVAETVHQAADAAELIEVEYEGAARHHQHGRCGEARRAAGWDDCENNICFELSVGDKNAVDAAFAKADHVVKHHFVINRITAATMEPRGCIGDYNPAEQHYTCYTTLQRAHVYRSELAEQVLKVRKARCVSSPATSAAASA